MSELSEKVFVNLELEMSVTKESHVDPLLETLRKVLENNLAENLDGIEIIEVSVQ